MKAKNDIDQLENPPGSQEIPGDERIDINLLQESAIGPTEKEVLAESPEISPEPGPAPEAEIQRIRLVLDLPPEASMLMSRGPFDILEGFSGREEFRLTESEEKGLMPYMAALMKTCGIEPRHVKWISIGWTSMAFLSLMSRKVSDVRRARKGEREESSPEIQDPGVKEAPGGKIFERVPGDPRDQERKEGDG